MQPFSTLFGVTLTSFIKIKKNKKKLRKLRFSDVMLHHIGLKRQRFEGLKHVQF